MSNYVRNVFSFLLIAFVLQFSAFPQNNNIPIVPKGFISSPVNTPYGLVFTNENNSIVYLAVNDKIETLFSSPGCGRYFTISKDGEKIGFKSIDPKTGMQAPAIYNLKTEKLSILENYTNNAGQVSFADNGTIVYTVEKNLIIAINNQKRIIDIGTYSNRTPISPDGNFVIFKDNEDQLWTLNLNSGSKNKFTNQNDGYANAQFSYDSKFIVYTTNGLKIFTYDISTGKTYFVAEGENPVWSGNSSQIIFFKKDIDYDKQLLLNSDIYIAGVDGEYIKNITNTSDTYEMEPSYDSFSNRIIFQTYSHNEIKAISLSNSNQPGNMFVLLKLNTPLEVKYFNNEILSSNKSNPPVLPDFVHIHQVYDTREDWNQGRSCCGAASCMEAIASFGILPPSPITTYGHISNFGKYISDSYTFNGYTFTGYSYWYAGAHGYLWNAGGSPYSNAVSFLQKHGISSARTDYVPWTSVIAEINQGFPYIVCTTQLTSAHIVMIVGQYGTQHSIYANDPYGDKNVGSYGYIRNGKNAIYDWSDANTGHEKITPVVWAVTAHFNQTAAPQVLSNYPANNQDSVKSIDTVSITFSQMMDKVSSEAAFSISPAVQGSFFWSNNNYTLNFKPDVTYDKSTQYVVTITNSAKNIFNINLAQSFSFTFKTRFRNRLILEKTYPADLQTNISTTAQFRFQFDAPVPNSSVIGNFELYDYNNIKLSITNGKIFYRDGKGFVYFEPKISLEKNKNYTILLKGKIADTEGIPLGDSTIILFITDNDNFQTGNVIDNFESVNNWEIQKQGNDIGIDTVATAFISASDRKISGTHSGKLNYTFTGNTGICQLNSLSMPAIGNAAGSEFGIWVFGDLSLNILEYWFTVNGNLVRSVVDTINWTGWKLKRIPVSIIGSDNMSFSNIVIKQTSLGEKIGSLYFDDAQYNIISAINEKGNDMHLNNFALSQNFPNPFNPATTIFCKIMTKGFYTLKVFNLLGQEAAVLNNKELQPGDYKFNFNAANLPSGVYIYRLSGSNVNISKKMVLLK